MFLSAAASGYSANGESAAVGSLGTIAGNLGSAEVLIESGLYLARRAATGWHLSPLNPPASGFIGQIPVIVDAESGESLWEQHTPEQSAYMRDLYLRSAAASFRLVGPFSPLVAPVEEINNVIFSAGNSAVRPLAVTHDFEHIVLEAEFFEARWPFDETTGGEAHSLYEYSGTSNSEPILVGVIGGKGSRQLLAKCGTRFGSGNQGTSYNGLSNDGETVFFTVEPCSPGPPKKEIYARRHGALTSPIQAETVHLSTSECTTGCGSEQSGKNFEGASKDGNKVFFTSTQKLTNDAIDGTSSGDAAEKEGCAHTKPGAGGCNLYEYDFDRPSGSLKVVSIGGGVVGVMGMAEDGSHVYYVSRTKIAAAGENVYHKAPSEGQPNLYVYDNKSEKTAFIATLSNGDEEDWIRRGRRSSEVIGEEGRTVLFVSSTPGLTPDDQSAPDQLFEYQAEGSGDNGPELIRISKGEDGFNEDGNGATSGVDPASIFTLVEQYSLKYDVKTATNKWKGSLDGKTIFFITAGRLSPYATSAEDGCTSLYEFHTDGLLSEGSVHLISDGRDTQLFKGISCGATFQATDASGANVLFTSADPLIPDDRDGEQVDIYDARVNGGFAPLVSGGCGSSSCEGRSGSPAVLPVASSTDEAVEAPVVSGTGKRHHAKMVTSGKSRRKKSHKRYRPARKRRHGLKAAGGSRSAKGGW